MLLPLYKVCLGVESEEVQGSIFYPKDIGYRDMLSPYSFGLAKV